jgi:hypothetical protein
MRHRFLLLRNGSQYIAGTRDMRQIDLRLDLIFATNRTRRPRRGRRWLGVSMEMFTNEIRLVVLK